jgi:hypothetical protein
MPNPSQDAQNLPKERLVEISYRPEKRVGKRPCPKPLSYCA